MTARNRIIPASLLLLAVVLGAPGALFASGVELKGVYWQVKTPKVALGLWNKVSFLQDAPPKLDSRIRAVAVIHNSSDKAIEGVLVRYGVSARLVADGGGVEGTWSVPCLISEKRLPKISPGQSVDVVLLVSPEFDLYLRRLSRSGWWIDRAKIQAVIEPHPKTTILQTAESVLELRR